MYPIKAMATVLTRLSRACKSFFGLRKKAEFYEIHQLGLMKKSNGAVLRLLSVVQHSRKSQYRSKKLH